MTACQVVMLERVMVKFLTELWRLRQCQSNCVTSNGHRLSSNRILAGRPVRSGKIGHGSNPPERAAPATGLTAMLITLSLARPGTVRPRVGKSSAVIRAKFNPPDSTGSRVPITA